jgi:hypothetical protein
MMVGTIAQLLTIVSYGNEYLNGCPAKLDKSMLYTGAAYRDDTNELIGGTNSWFSHLQQNGCKKIRLFYNVSAADKEHSVLLLHDYLVWMYEAVYEGFSEIWTTKWRCSDTGWWARTIQTAAGQPVKHHPCDIDAAKMALAQKLTALSEFAQSTGWYNWTKIFNNMKKDLSNDNPAFPQYHSQMIVEKNYSLPARQLLCAAEAAWCFTGSGSWADNDMFSKQDEDKNESLTKELFFAVCDAYVCGINSF